jgi:hypothetical protein
MSSQVENKDKKVVDLTSATYLRKFHVTKHHKQKKRDIKLKESYYGLIRKTNSTTEKQKTT